MPCVSTRGPGRDAQEGGIPIPTRTSTRQCSRHTVYKALAQTSVAIKEDNEASLAYHIERVQLRQ
jgi:hypothetical protein